MIPNEASCPVFSFTFRRKSVVELRMSGRKEKRKKKKRKENARVYFYFYRPSFSLHFISVCSPFVLPRFPVLCRDANHDSRSIWRVAKCRCVWFWKKKQKKKKEKTRADRPVTCVSTADRTRTCALFILFPKVAKKRMCVIFVRVTRCGETGKKWKGKMQNNDNKRYDKRDGNVRRKLMIFN